MKGVVFLGDRKLELREFPDPKTTSERFQAASPRIKKRDT
jgi:hypothetical protein